MFRRVSSLAALSRVQFVPKRNVVLKASMGHGDSIVIADANFPAEAVAKHNVRTNVVSASGLSATAVLEAILAVFPLDTYVEKPAAVMQCVSTDGSGDAPIISEFQVILDNAHGQPVSIDRIERFAFYAAARKSFAVVSTGETRLYGNIILKKGVIGGL